MPNLFQSSITPLKPNVLSTERIYVYVPEATYTTKGIASFEENEFAMNDGHVQLNTDYLSASPFTRPSLIQLNNEDFVFEDGIASLNWTKLRDFTDARIHLITDPLTGRVEVLERGLAQEIIDRQNADTALGRRIDDEIAARIGGDSALGVRIDNEILDRKAADMTLGGRIDDEILARGAADTALSNRITTIEGLIPDDATISNKLISYNSAADMINSVTAYYITKNAVGDPFGTKDELLAATVFYSGGQIRVPTRNDYCYVQADTSKGTSVGTFDTTSKYIGYWIIYDNEGIEVTNANKDSVGIVPGTTIAYSNIPTTRYSYQGNQWEFQVIVNESPLTTAQLAALNSGITEEKVAKIDTAVQSVVINDLYKTVINSTGSTITIQKAFVSAPSGTAAESNIIGIDVNAKAYMSSSEVHGVTANPQYTSSKIYTDNGIIKYEVTHHNVLDFNTMTYSDVVTDGEIATLNDLSNFVDLSVIAEEYNVGEIYNTGDYVIYNNELYIATANNISGSWDNTKWDMVNIAQLITELSTNKQDKPTDESYTIASNSWTALGFSDPYTYSATVTATYTIGNDTEVGIVADQPVLFANYGFVVGAVSGQNVTIYALEQPETSVTLSVSYRG